MKPKFSSVVFILRASTALSLEPLRLAGCATASATPPIAGKSLIITAPQENRRSVSPQGRLIRRPSGRQGAAEAPLHAPRPAADLLERRAG